MLRRTGLVLSQATLNKFYIRKWQFSAATVTIRYEVKLLAVLSADPKACIPAQPRKKLCLASNANCTYLVLSKQPSHPLLLPVMSDMQCKTTLLTICPGVKDTWFLVWWNGFSDVLTGHCFITCALTCVWDHVKYFISSRIKSFWYHRWWTHPNEVLLEAYQPKGLSVIKLTIWRTQDTIHYAP